MLFKVTKTLCNCIVIIQAQSYLRMNHEYRKAVYILFVSSPIFAKWSQEMILRLLKSILVNMLLIPLTKALPCDKHVEHANGIRLRYVEDELSEV